MEQTILSALQFRYATKQFDTTKKLSEEHIHTILESARLAPSSFGLEPWKFFVVSNTDLREKLRQVAWNQSQITDASHVIVIASKKTMTPFDVDEFISRIADTRSSEKETLSGYSEMMKNTISARSQQEILDWNKRQCYIALGMILETAALLGVDACPMEGFDPSGFDALLGISDSDYTSVVICPVGYRADSDGYAHAKKVRKPQAEVVVRIA